MSELKELQLQQDSLTLTHMCDVILESVNIGSKLETLEGMDLADSELVNLTIETLADRVGYEGDLSEFHSEGFIGTVAKAIQNFFKRLWRFFTDSALERKLNALHEHMEKMIDDVAKGLTTDNKEKIEKRWVDEKLVLDKEWIPEPSVEWNKFLNGLMGVELGKSWGFEFGSIYICLRLPKDTHFDIDTSMGGSLKLKDIPLDDCISMFRIYSEFMATLIDDTMDALKRCDKTVLGMAQAECIRAVLLEVLTLLGQIHNTLGSFHKKLTNLKLIEGNS